MIGLGLVVGGCFMLAACSGGTSSGAASAARAAGVPAAAPAGTGAALGNQPPPNGAAKSSTSGGAAGTTALLTPAEDIIYTAQLAVRVPDVSTAAARATQLAQAAGGYVSAETLTTGSGASASVQLKIPVPLYQSTLSQLAATGTQLSLQQQAQNVTEEVADVNSEVASDQAAITQLDALMSHAGSVGDLLEVQNQISTEESTLDSIEAQQRALSHETTYATVTMSILGPQAKPAPVKHHKPKPLPGLGGGLSDGWHALRITVAWTLTFLGTIAPFAAVLALAYALYRLRHRILRRHPA
jgi:Domain of unknown function (DUF4349)